MYNLKIVFTIILLFFSQSVLADWVPFKMKNNKITFNIEINGEKAVAVLDAGIPTRDSSNSDINLNMISQKFVNKHQGVFKDLGKARSRSAHKIRVEGVNGSFLAQIYNNVPVKVFGMDFSLDHTVAGNLVDADLLLGSHFFENNILHIDFPNSRLQVFPRKSIDMNKFANVPMKKERGTGSPAIKTKLNGEKVWLTLDIGNSDSIYVKRSLVIDEEWITDTTKIKKSTITGLVKTINSEIITVDDFKIGPFEMEDVAVHFPADGEKSNIGKTRKEQATDKNSRISRGINTKGTIGLDILKNFIVTIDFYDYKMHITTP